MEILLAGLGVLLTGVLIVSFLVQDVLAIRGKVSLPTAGQQRYKRNTRMLWALIGLAIAYSGLLRLLRSLTGISVLDGGIGVALGLYICAHPAANAVNMLFFERDTLRHISDWSVIRWLALNLLTLLAGWMAIYVGITRLVARGA
jgi:hypothetical protein